MATRTIVTKLKLDGESEYKAALKNINAEYQLHRSELEKAAAQYKNNANSLEALEAKQSALKNMLGDLGNKHSQHSAMLEEARQAQQKYAEQAERLRTKLDGLKDSTRSAADEEKKLAEELADAERKIQEAQNSITYYQKQLNNTERDQAKFSTELSQTERYLDEARSSADRCASSIDQYGKEIKQAGKDAEDFGVKSKDAAGILASALAAAGAAKGIQEITRAIRECVDASVEFESAITGVYKTVEGTPEQLAEISSGIKQMSTEIPATTAEISAVAEAAGQLGIATQDVLSFTRVMLNLGESTNLSADEAATALARFANITGTSAGDYERLGSVIVGLGNNFATTESEITEMATRLASAGTLAGMTEAEILALAAAMSSVGIEAEAGGTAMTQTLTVIEKAVATGGDKLNEFARIAGMSTADFSSAWKNDAIVAVQAFIAGLAGLEAQGENAVLALDALGLTGVRQSNMLKSLALAADTMSAAVTLSNRAWTENIALAEEAGKRYGTLESKLAMMDNAFSNTKAAIGDALAPALERLAEAGTEAFSWSAEFIEQNPWLVHAIAGVVTAIATLAAGLAALTVAHKAAGALSALNMALAANPAVAVASAIAGLAVAIGAFIAKANESAQSNRELTASLHESRAAYEESQKVLAGERDELLSTVSALTALSEAEHKSTAQKESLLSLVEQLNEAVPSLNLAYDEQTDSLNMTADAIRELALSQAEASERAAAVERLSQLYVEQEKITNELASAEAQLAQAEETKARMLEEGTYWLAENDAAMEQTERTIAASESTIRSMTEAQTENTAEIAAAEEKYGSLAEASGGLAGQTAETAGVIEGLTENAEELEEKTKALAGAQDTLTTALKEQAEGGSLALDTTLSLIDAGYGAALAIDTETGAVSLNKDTYIAIAKAKIDEQLASLETQRISLETSIRLKDEAYMALSVAQSYIEAKAAKDELDELMTDYRSTQAAIAALNKLKENLNDYSSSASSAARQTASASKTMRTQAQKDLDAFKNLQKDLDHQRAMGEISEKEYYDALAEYRDAYLTDDENLDEYRKINEAIYKHDRQLAEDEKKLWEEQTENLVDELENRVDEVVGKQQDLRQKLEGFGDLYSMEKGPDGKDRMVVNDPEKQAEALSEFEDILTRLKEGGLSDGLMNEILAMDIDEAMEYGKQLLGMSEEQFEAYNKAWDEKQKKALEISARFYAGELETIEKEYNRKLGERLDGLKTTAFTSGEDTVQGLIDGMEEKEQALYEKAQSIIGEVSRLMNAGSAPTLAEPKRDGSHAGGLSYVPFDGYVAELHRGERVLTAEEARAYISRSIPASLEPPVKPQSDMGQMLQTAINAVIGTRGREDAGGDLVIEVPVNGEKLARAILRDFRNVARANPEVKSEF